MDIEIKRSGLTIFKPKLRSLGPELINSEIRLVRVDLIGLAILLLLELVQKWLNFVCAVQLRLALYQI